MPQEELDLLQLASRSMTEPSTGPSQIVWRQLRHADALGGFLHNVPNRLHCHAISPCPSNFVDPAEQFSSINSGCGEPIVEFGSHPIRNWNCSNVASHLQEARQKICTTNACSTHHHLVDRLIFLPKILRHSLRLLALGRGGITSIYSDQSRPMHFRDVYRCDAVTSIHGSK